jgi:hypothetical protein
LANVVMVAVVPLVLLVQLAFGVCEIETNIKITNRYRRWFCVLP